MLSSFFFPTRFSRKPELRRGTVHRVPECLSLRRNWVPPPHRRVWLPLPQDPSEGETHSLVGKGVGGPNSDEWTESLVLYVCYNPSTPSSHPQKRKSKLKSSEECDPLTLFSFFQQKPWAPCPESPWQEGLTESLQTLRDELYLPTDRYKVTMRYITDIIDITVSI